MRRGRALIATLVVLTACGSRTGLQVPERLEDAAPSRPDAGSPRTVDGGRPPNVDECVELPPREPPAFVDVGFVARISAADVLFLIDVTGSMGDEIERIRRTLRDTLIPAMVETIPDVQLSVASFGDFGIVPYGSERDRPFVLEQPSTSNADAVQNAVVRLRMGNGGDGPESQVEALWQTATGLGRGVHVAPRRCPEDTVGYPCFRSDGSRIVLLFTDAEFHNGPGDTEVYRAGEITPSPATYREAVAALNGIGAKVLGLFSGGFGADDAHEDLKSVARETGAVTPDGQPIVIDIGPSGERLDRGVIESVQTLVDEVPIDVDTLIEDWDGDAVDATDFVRGVQTLRADPPSGAIDRGDSYERVRPGTRVEFRVGLVNERIPQTAVPQVFYLTVVLRGDRVTRLKETDVAIVVPSIGGVGCEILEP